MALPKGLDETIRAFFKGCEAGGKTTDTLTITLNMVDRLIADFQSNESEWEQAKNQLKTIAGLSGRLASSYAELDGKTKRIEWRHARLGLRDGKAECQEVLGVSRAKHCLCADFETE